MISSGLDYVGLEEMSCIISLRMNQNIFALVDARWRLDKGVPIGGLVSKALLSLVAGGGEALFDEEGWDAWTREECPSRKPDS